MEGAREGFATRAASADRPVCGEGGSAKDAGGVWYERVQGKCRV